MSEMVGNPKTKRGLSSFSVILIMIVFMIIGIALLPLLNIRYTPSSKHRDLQLNLYWPQASPRVIEQEVTSRLEASFVRLKEIESVSSASGKGWGRVQMRLKKGVDIDLVRFEASTLIRQLYPHFPQGVSYPTFSNAISGNETSTLMTYNIYGNLSAESIRQYTEQNILPAISIIDGLNDVKIYGVDDNEWEVCFKTKECSVLGVGVDQIRQALLTYGREDILGLFTENKSAEGEGGINISLRNGALPKTKEKVQYELEDILITRVSEKWIRLRDIATIRFKEKSPEQYYRVNGQNNITLRIIADQDVNTPQLCAIVREKMANISEQMPSTFKMDLAYDQSEQLQKQLNQIYLRSGLSILILLLFVYITSRKLRYVFLITVTMLANICIAFIFYYMAGVEINIYSLAAITISLGLIIDTSIIMIDHYNYYHNKKVFLAILGALLTTIGTIVIVFFLPESQRLFLEDFAAVIIINLSVSLLISLFFIPALSDRLPILSSEKEKTIKSLRRKVHITNIYRGFILAVRSYKYLLIALLILLFGIPINQLPLKIEAESEGEELTKVEKWYNQTIGSTFYQETLKPFLDPALGGTLRLFTSSVYKENFYVEPQRTVLYINAGMGEGYKVKHLNDIMKRMEQLLSNNKSPIERYETSISNYRSASIEVTFTEEAENSDAPSQLRNKVDNLASSIGNVFWNIYGVGNAFNQQQFSGHIRMNRVKLSGYNYELLQKYAEQLLDSCVNNKRLQNPVIISTDNVRSRPYIEYDLTVDKEKLLYYNLGLSAPHTSLRTMLFNEEVKHLKMANTMLAIRLVSDEKERFDLWHLAHDQLKVENGVMKFSDLGKIEKKEIGNNIYRKDQVYNLFVASNYNGDSRLINRVINKYIKSLNLPLGFKAEILPPYNFGQFNTERTPYELLLLVVVIIYFICAMLFESLWQPLVIVSLIPVSFIGVFLTFYLFNVSFDQGGFASFILLAGLVVNAGIYIINEYNIICRSSGRSGINAYLQAFNHKIVPVSLTIFSTVLGLIPFVWIGQKEVFWYSFAAGTMGGMCFSILALVVCLPIFMKFNVKPKSVI